MLERECIRYHPFPLTGVEPMSATTARTYARHTHDLYGIGVVDAGGHASWSDQGQVEAGPGQFICLNPGEIHDGRAIGEQGRSWRMLYLEPELVRQICTDVLESPPLDFAFTAPVFVDGLLFPLFETAFAYSRSAAGMDAKLACETAVVNLVARLGSHSNSNRPPDPLASVCIRRARNRIDDDPTASLTLSALAREAGLSRYQLIRGFARELGLPPHAYILQRRLALARRLIREGRSLTQVAIAAGFYDQSHLTRCFVRQFGVTPGRYAAHTQ